jgi:hypothetical protein
MALSIGFRIFSFLPSCYSSYGALNFYPDGTFTHCSCQPSLDAHFSFLIQRTVIAAGLADANPMALIRRFDSDEDLVPFLVFARFWWDGPQEKSGPAV